MNKEKQRIKIAEACGWRWDGKFFGADSKAGDFWISPEGESFLGLPDYLNNLNPLLRDFLLGMGLLATIFTTGFVIGQIIAWVVGI